MLLCADIGNSHTTLGLVEDGDVMDKADLLSNL